MSGLSLSSTPSAPSAPPVVPDVPDGGGIAAGLQITLGRLASATEQLCAQQDRAARAKQLLPVPIALSGVAPVPSPAGPVVIDIGGPMAGRQWTVRRWSICAGDDVTTAITGATRADLYIGRPVGSRGLPSQWADTNATVPGIKIPSSEAIIVLPSDHLFVIVTGASTVGQQVVFTAYILEAPQASYVAVQEV